ncbi:Rust resistance kinase Lr10 [Ranunculus cassubicifolius]
MKNESLERFIYAEKIENMSSFILGSEKLYQIALGIARGLEYVHRGCNTRILHFDIKPHNILLDENFLPKISDFGLAKLCPTKESVVSMIGARGTMGYIAPEVYCRNMGGVSHKSDVYSYGMMVLEMIGGRKNIDATVENTSAIYFPRWIYHQLKREIRAEESEAIKLEIFTEFFEVEIKNDNSGSLVHTNTSS